jgi:hypothetical protein
MSLDPVGNLALAIQLVVRRYTGSAIPAVIVCGLLTLKVNTVKINMNVKFLCKVTPSPCDIQNEELYLYRLYSSSCKATQTVADSVQWCAFL